MGNIYSTLCIFWSCAYLLLGNYGLANVHDSLFICWFSMPLSDCVLWTRFIHIFQKAHIDYKSCKGCDWIMSLWNMRRASFRLHLSYEATITSSVSLYIHKRRSQVLSYSVCVFNSSIPSCPQMFKTVMILSYSFLFQISNTVNPKTSRRTFLFFVKTASSVCS